MTDPEPYGPARPAEVATVQARLDELWTKTAAAVALGGVRFLARSDVGERHKLVSAPRIGVRLPRLGLTHAKLEAAVWPSLGQQLLRACGAGDRPYPLHILPTRTLGVLAWDATELAVEARIYLFEWQPSRLALPPGVAP